MCVIAVYEKNLALNMSELERCFYSNPDGAGLMYQEKGLVHIEKGFMEWAEFKQAVEKLPANVDRVFHFRIATSGKISGACCHPFPICNDYKKMSRLSCTSKMGFAHNGVLADFTPNKGIKDTKSDTMVFNKQVLSRLGDTLNNEAVRDLIELYTTSRFAILTPSKVYTIGNWEQSRESGAFYSNSSYNGYRWEFASNCLSYPSNKNKGVTPIYDRWDDYDDYWDYSQYARVKSKKLTDEQVDGLVTEFEDQFNVIVYDVGAINDEYLLYFDGPKPTQGSIKLSDGRIVPFKVGTTAGY